MAERAHLLGDSSLVELLDRLIETGVVATGDVVLGLADVDLVRVSLQLVLGSVDELAAEAPPAPVTARPPVTASAPNASALTASASTGQAHNSTTAQYAATSNQAPTQNQATMQNPAPAQYPAPATLPDLGDADRGIGALLVAVIELVRQLLERQAIHRMERGSLTDDQVERLGRALQELDRKVGQLIEMFGTRSAERPPLTAVN